MNALHKWFAKFVAKVAIMYSLLVLVFLFLVRVNGFYALELLEARIVFEFMRLFYPGITLSGKVLENLVVSGHYSNFSVSIDAICLGFFPIAAFVSMALALPLQRKKIGKCLAVGIPVLFIANLARITLVLFIAAWYDLLTFNFFHLSVVKYDLMLLVVAVFLLCVKFVIGKKALLESIREKNKKS